MYAVLCDAAGKTMLGSDGYLRADGRLAVRNLVVEAAAYRERFKPNFRFKYDFWTHVGFVRDIGLDTMVRSNLLGERLYPFEG